MKWPTAVEGLALFGSVPRGDSDLESDRDILVIAESNRPQLSNHFASLGYSPSIYRWRDLEKLSIEGSLFLQHLKQESRIIYDPNRRLSALLTQFFPGGEYRKRVVENRALFAMTSGVPCVPGAVAWAFDVLAVAFRNHAILRCAQHGHYVFSFSELIERFASEHNLTGSDISALSELRQRKHNYRRSLNKAYCSEDYSLLRSLQTLLQNLVQVGFEVEPRSPIDFAEGMFQASADQSPWYHCLRRYEGAYRALGYLSEGETVLAAELESAFTMPSPYTSSGGSSVDWMRSRVWEIVAAHHR